jgi:DNA polymerase-3 subunit beta
MDFRIDQSRFLNALSLAQSVADRKGTGVTANVLISAHADHRVICVATDNNLSITESIEAETERTGSLTVSAKHLLAVLRTMPAGPLRVESLENNRIQLTSGRATIQLLGLPERDFPARPDAATATFHTLPTKILRTLIDRTLFSVSSDETRVNLNGALFEASPGTLTMVSTDGHRLTKCSVKVPEHPFGEQRLILPRKGLVELKKVLDQAEETIEVAQANGYFFARSLRLILTIKLNNVTFPPYQQVIPKKYDRQVRLPRQEFLGCLRRAAVLAPEKTSTVRIELRPNILELVADNPELGIATQQMELEYSGLPLMAGFNADYLIAALEAMDEEMAILEFQGELDPCVIRPGIPPEAKAESDLLAVVMPMRI